MKPLSYALRGDGIVYCSELRALYAFDRSALRIAPGAVMEYLAFGYVPDPNSIFEGVTKLPAAHFLVWSPGREVHVQRYWRPPLPDGALRDEAELVSELRQRLEAAVTSHLESEVPLGAFLSGGTDSSMVVAMMCRHAAGRVKTFSIGFAEAEYDESQAARAVATRLGTEHTELLVRPDVEQIFESVAAMFDEPFADSSAIPTFLVAQLARQSVTVALSGDGGDELFGGYTRYGETLRRGGGARGPSSRFIGALGLMLPHAFPGRNRLVDLGRSRLGRYASSVVQPVRVDEGGVASAWHPAARRTVDEQLYRFTSADEAEDFAALMMRLDFETYLAGDILTKVDRTSMAVSLEARVPLLDFDLVDFALRIPGELRVTPAESKRLYRRAISGIVPDFVLTAPKRGFAVPLARWFRGPLRHRIQALRNPSAALEQYLDGRAVERLIAEHSIGRRDHSVLLWRLIVLNYWLAAFADGRLGRPPLVPPFSSSGTRALSGQQARVSKSSPPRVSNLFLHAQSPLPRLRVALIVDANGIPAYARGVIEDLCSADYVDIAFVAVQGLVATGGAGVRDGFVLRAYASLVESRYQLYPDPLELGTATISLRAFPDSPGRPPVRGARRADTRDRGGCGDSAGCHPRLWHPAGAAAPAPGGAPWRLALSLRRSAALSARIRVPEGNHRWRTADGHRIGSPWREREGRCNSHAGGVPHCPFPLASGQPLWTGLGDASLRDSKPLDSQAGTRIQSTESPGPERGGFRPGGGAHSDSRTVRSLDAGGAQQPGLSAVQAGRPSSALADRAAADTYAALRGRFARGAAVVSLD